MYIVETWSGPKECILLVDTKKKEHTLFKFEEGYVTLKKTGILCIEFKKVEESKLKWIKEQKEPFGYY